MCHLEWNIGIATGWFGFVADDNFVPPAVHVAGYPADTRLNSYYSVTATASTFWRNRFLTGWTSTNFELDGWMFEGESGAAYYTQDLSVGPSCSMPSLRPPMPSFLLPPRWMNR